MLKDNKHNLKRRKQQYRKSILILLTKEDRLASFFEQRYSVLFDPPGDGNCQFHAIAHGLSHYVIYRSTQSLRTNIVRHLENNPNDCHGKPLELFMGMPFSVYVGQMPRNCTYGDQLILRAASEGYGDDYVLLRESSAPSAENEKTDFSLEGRSGSGTKYEVIDVRNTGCVVQMHPKEKEHEVEMDATEKEHEVEMDATDTEHEAEVDETNTEHKVVMGALETDHEVEIEKQRQ